LLGHKPLYKKSEEKTQLSGKPYEYPETARFGNAKKGLDHYLSCRFIEKTEAYLSLNSSDKKFLNLRLLVG